MIQLYTDHDLILRIYYEATRLVALCLTWAHDESLRFIKRYSRLGVILGWRLFGNGFTEGFGRPVDALGDGIE